MYRKRQMTAKRKTTAQKNKRRIQRQRPTARNQKRQIATTQNQIMAIQKHLKLQKQRIRWHCGFHNATINGYPLVIPLTSGPSEASPAQMNTVLGTPVPWKVVMTTVPEQGSNLRSKVVVNKQYVDLTITAGNEASLLQYTAFVVQLEPKTAQQTYKGTTNMSNLRRDEEFITTATDLGLDSGYGAYLNNDKFKIIKRIEFETGGNSPSDSGPEATGSTGNHGRGTNSWYMKRAQLKINYGSTIFKSAGNSDSTTTLTYDNIDPETKRFIIIFSDNGTGDLESPTVSMSSLITGYALE